MDNRIKFGKSSPGFICCQNIICWAKAFPRNYTPNVSGIHPHPVPPTGGSGKRTGILTRSGGVCFFVVQPNKSAVPPKKAPRPRFGRWTLPSLLSHPPPIRQPHSQPYGWIVAAVSAPPLGGAGGGGYA
jgi:hypothetical protein